MNENDMRLLSLYTGAQPWMTAEKLTEHIISVSGQRKERGPMDALLASISPEKRNNGRKAAVKKSAYDLNDPKPSDMRERAVNNRASYEKEDEVYNPERYDLRTYNEMIDDDTIRLSTQIIVGFISKLGFRVQSSDPRVTAVVRAALEPVFSQLIRDMVREGLKNGFMFSQKIWARRRVTLTDKSSPEKEILYQGYMVYPEKIKTLNPNNRFRFFIDTDADEIVRVEQHVKKDIETFWRHQLVWFALDRTYSGVWGNSRYKSAYKPWFYFGATMIALLDKLAKTGDPPVVVEFPPGETDTSEGPRQNDEIALDILEQAMTNKAIALPSERDEKSGEPLWNIKFLEIANAEVSNYMTVLDLLEKQKAQSLGVFGAFVGKSNFSELDAKEDLVMITVEDIVDQIEAVVRTDVVDQIIAYNFGPKRISEVEFEIDRNSLGRSKMMKEILKTAMQIQSSYAQMGYFSDAMPDIKAICADLGIPFRSQLDQLDERTLSVIEAEKQKQIEKQSQQKAEQAKQAAKSQEQRNEQSNDPNKRPTETRDRTRPAKDKDITEGE